MAHNNIPHTPEETNFIASWVVASDNLQNTIQNLPAYAALDDDQKKHIVSVFRDRLVNYFSNDILFPRELGNDPDNAKITWFLAQVQSRTKTLAETLHASAPEELLNKHMLFDEGNTHDKSQPEQSNQAYLKVRQERHAKNTIKHTLDGFEWSGFGEENTSTDE